MKEQNEDGIKVGNNNNNLSSKPLNHNSVKSLNLADSAAVLNGMKVEDKPFNFIDIKNEPIIFKFNNLDNLELIYKELQPSCRYVICILIQDDTHYSSTLLEHTLAGIRKNLQELNHILIKPENILICIMFNKIINDFIFNDNDKVLLKSNTQYILKQASYIVDNESINLHLISKLDYFYDIEILKFYYSNTINQLRINNTIIFSSIITAGVIPSGSLLYLIKLSYNSKNTHSIVIPSLDEIDSKEVISQVRKYERIHFNIYNMNYYDMTASAPISSLLNVMTIDNLLFPDLLSFYQVVPINATIDYHDYSLSLYLFRNRHKIIYYNKIPMGIYETKVSEHPICDYKNSWVNRYSGYYGNFFNILNTFLDMEVCGCSKFFLFFHIIGLMIEFIFPSLSTMVIYTIFYEAFDSYDARPAAFCTLLYVFVLISSGACSLISQNSHKMVISNIFFYIFMEIYYIFILVCSIVAMDTVKENKNLDPYKFNTAAVVCIILFTFFPAIFPMLFRTKIIFPNFFSMILYLILGAPASSTSFHMAKILNSSDTSGGNNITEKKGILLIYYFLINLFFGSLTLYNYTREKRVKAVMGLGVFYLIYNFFKIVAIIAGLMESAKNLSISFNIDEQIKDDFNKQIEYANNNNEMYNNDGEQQENESKHDENVDETENDDVEQNIPTKNEIEKKEFPSDNINQQQNGETENKNEINGNEPNGNENNEQNDNLE